MKKMIKRKDGSYSQRGLWDNIRANKGSGKEPTKDMLKQESKIKKEENMNSMYKKGGKKTSKKKVMKEAKMEGESFIQENKELSFGAPQMKKGGMMKYESGGNPDTNKDKKLSVAEVRADMKERANKPSKPPKPETAQQKKENAAREAAKLELEKAARQKASDWRINSGLDALAANPFDKNSKGYNEDTYDMQMKRLAEKAYGKKKMGGAKSMEPGGGGRFAALVGKLKSKGKSEESAKAIAASVGRKKYGKSRFQEMAAAGKKRMGGKKC